MQISTKAWVKYINRLSAVNKRAGDLMTEYIQRHGFGDTQSIIDFAYGLVTKYGEASAEIACQMYDAIAEMQGAIIPPAEPASTASIAEVGKAVNGTLKQSEVLIPSTVSRLVKQAGADTTLKNAIRDGAQWAWIPHGDTCAFCLTLASRGWQTASKRSLKNGHAEHIHANCNCEYAIRFDGKSGVSGYNPDEYLEMYYDAEGATPKDRINAMRREHYAANREQINAQKRAAYAARAERKEEKVPKAEAPPKTKALTGRSKLEADAKQLYIANGGHANLSAEEAAKRFDLLVDGNTDAQLRKYIKKNSRAILRQNT